MAMARYHSEVSLVLFTNRENDHSLRDDLSAFEQVEFNRLDFAAANRYVRIVREQVELPRRARQAAVDVLWSPGYTAPFRAHCPQVVTVLDMQYKRFPRDMTRPARLTSDILIRLGVRRCRVVLTLSEFAKREIVTFAGAPSDKVHVTRLAADGDFASRLSGYELRARLGPLLKEPGPYLLCVAHSYPHKNLHTLVDAFGRLQNEIPHRLALVGKARPGERQLAAAVSRLPDPRRLVRMPSVSKDDLNVLYQGADIFVFPSLYEGFGLPVLEAMMAGAPVIASRRASIPEVGGENIVYVEALTSQRLAEKVREVLAWNKAERAEWVNAARARAEQFSWQSTAAVTVAALRRALADKPGTAGPADCAQ
jgi:glycosyltransferase involved in cell wall biosynthesis